MSSTGIALGAALAPSSAFAASLSPDPRRDPAVATDASIEAAAEFSAYASRRFGTEKLAFALTGQHLHDFSPSAKAAFEKILPVMRSGQFPLGEHFVEGATSASKQLITLHDGRQRDRLSITALEHVCDCVVGLAKESGLAIAPEHPAKRLRMMVTRSHIPGEHGGFNVNPMTLTPHASLGVGVDEAEYPPENGWSAGVSYWASLFSTNHKSYLATTLAYANDDPSNRQLHVNFLTNFWETLGNFVDEVSDSAKVTVTSISHAFQQWMSDDATWFSYAKSVIGDVL